MRCGRGLGVCKVWCDLGKNELWYNGGDACMFKKYSSLQSMYFIHFHSPCFKSMCLMPNVASRQQGQSGVQETCDLFKQDEVFILRRRQILRGRLDRRLCFFGCVCELNCRGSWRGGPFLVQQSKEKQNIPSNSCAFNQYVLIIVALIRESWGVSVCLKVLSLVVPHDPLLGTNWSKSHSWEKGWFDEKLES